MRRRFLENLIFFTTLNLLIKPIYVFGIDRVVQNTVGTINYGTYFPLLNLVLIFQIFLDLGIENFTRKELAHNPGMRNRLFSSFLTVKLVLILLFISIFSFVGYLIPHSPNEWKLLFFLVLNQSMASLILYLRANMGGMHLFKAESIVSVLDRLFMILICGSLLVLPATKTGFKIEWFVYAQTIAYLLTLLVSFIVVVTKTSHFRLQFRLISYIPILKQLKPYAILVLLMAFYYRIDSVFLRYLLPDGKEQAGIYAHGFRILDFMSNYALIFAFILLPTFAQMIRKKETITPLLRLASLSLIIPCIALVTSIAFYRYDVFLFLYPDSGKVSADVFLVLTISFIGICISYTFGALLTANGNLKQLIAMATSAVLISTILNLILIPKYKVLGAAVANSASQLFTIIFHMVVTSRKFRIRLDNTLLFKLVLFLAFTIGTGFFVRRLPITWPLGITIITASSFVFAISTSLLKPSYLFQLANKYKQKDELSTG